MSLKILLITPPMTQLNTPYPATAYLKGFLKHHSMESVQADFSLELALRLFSKDGLRKIRATLNKKKSISAEAQFFLDRFKDYENCIEPAVHFLQGKDPSLALRIVGREFIPEGPQFAVLNQFEDLSGENQDPLAWAFGTLGIQDRAKYICSLLINDLSSLIHNQIDGRFELARYGESLASSVATFEPLENALQGKATLIDELLFDLVDEWVKKVKPDVVALTVPFPGNVYGAFQIAKRIKADHSKKIKIIMGGGYVNTELRSLSEPKVFNYIDFITLDDGYRPLLQILKLIREESTPDQLLRTFIRKNKKVELISDKKIHDISQKEAGTPSYEGLHYDRYLSILEMLNPMHRIWSDGRWNKLTIAHGCYWKKCSFCDIGLDYISRYEPNTGSVLVDRIQTLIQETGQSGFHFVDEAAPPAVIRSMSEELIRRNVIISWWGNIRFEKSFDATLTKLMAKSGCVAISGGLEVASNRLLKLMDKGVTVEQVARVTKSFSDSGIMVHAYLMYGFPTETIQETIDSLERVRQLFYHGCIQSGFWHKFTATAHSPIGQDPKSYNIKIINQPKKVTFAENGLEHSDPTRIDHDALGIGLKKALYNYMHGIGLDEDVRHWFNDSRLSIPKTKVPKNLIEQALTDEPL